MKSIFFATALLSSSVMAWVDLGPAYRVHTPGGTEDWKLIRTFDKKPLFVEGFEMADDETFIESVGQYYGSRFQRVSLDDESLETVVEQETSLPQSLFGEGCTLFKDEIYQMTYREGKVLVYDPVTLNITRQMSMPKEMEEGWGLTHDTNHIYASDGTDRLFKINASDFKVLEIIRVKDK